MKIIDATTKTVFFTQASWTRTPWQRARGLLGTSSLSDQQALIFKNAPCIHTFFMRFAIDIIFMDRHGTIVRLARRIPPGRIICCWRSYYTVEVCADAGAERSLYEGQTLEIS